MVRSETSSRSASSRAVMRPRACKSSRIESSRSARKESSFMYAVRSFLTMQEEYTTEFLSTGVRNKHISLRMAVDSFSSISHRPMNRTTCIGLARHPGKKRACDQKVCSVQQALQHGGLLGIANKGVQDVTDSSIFTQDVRRVPEGRCADMKPAQALHILDSVTEQSSGEDEQEQAHHTEEDTVVKPVAQAIDQEAQCQGCQQAK